MAVNVKKIQKNPQLWLAAACVSALIAVGYKVYDAYATQQQLQASEGDTATPGKLKRQYTNKLIALTLSHLILNLQLPLLEILHNLENVTFILPPNLDEDDVNYNIQKLTATLPEEVRNNYKLLKCQNIQGYFTVLKNLKPDMLLMCQDDLGLSTHSIPKDLNRFIKQIVFVDQNNDDISTKVAPLFVH